MRTLLSKLQSKQTDREVFLKFRIIVILILITAFLLLGPFLIPVNDYPDTLPVEEIAGPDATFIETDTFNAHIKIQGSGEPVFILLHGFGCTLNTWQLLQEPLSAYGRVISMDLPGAGLTRLLDHQIDSQIYSSASRADLVIEIMDQLGIGEAVLVGNSAGGKLAAEIASTYPERINALILIDPAIFCGGTPAFLQPVFQTPQLDHLGALFARVFMKQWQQTLEQSRYQPDRLPEELQEAYQRTTKIEGWDRELWQLIRSPDESEIEGSLPDIHAPTLILHGEFDTLVPHEDSRKTADMIPGAEFHLIASSGHLPQEENPELVLSRILAFLTKENLLN